MSPAAGERYERCLWQMKRAERVAAVEKIEEKRKPDDFFGHRNRGSADNYLAIKPSWNQGMLAPGKHCY